MPQNNNNLTTAWGLPLDRDVYLYQLAVTAYNSRQPGSSHVAIAHLTDALISNPRNTSAYFLRARIYREQERYQNAILDLGVLLAININNINLYAEVGLNFHLMQLYPRAYESFRGLINHNLNAYSQENQLAATQALASYAANPISFNNNLWFFIEPFIEGLLR